MFEFPIYVPELELLEEPLEELPDELVEELEVELPELPPALPLLFSDVEEETFKEPDEFAGSLTELVLTLESSTTLLSGIKTAHNRLIRIHPIQQQAINEKNFFLPLHVFQSSKDLDNSSMIWLCEDFLYPLDFLTFTPQFGQYSQSLGIFSPQYSQYMTPPVPLEIKLDNNLC